MTALAAATSSLPPQFGLASMLPASPGSRIHTNGGRHLVMPKCGGTYANKKEIEMGKRAIFHLCMITYLTLRCIHYASSEPTMVSRKYDEDRKGLHHHLLI
ncbi:hypothetical protein ACFX1X_006107 [Malus domestica]